MKNKKVFVAGFIGMISLALLLAFALPGTAGPNPDQMWTGKKPAPTWWTWGDAFEKRKPVRGGYLKTAAPQYIGLMNPNHWPVNDWVAMTYFFEMLIYNDGQFKPTTPWLAESWEFTDPMTCVMKLRKGVQFHDGSPFNAESVRYQIEWIKDRSNGAWSRGWIEPVKSIEAIDEYTVKWTFTKPWGSFLGIMANVPGYPISKKALEGDTFIMQAEDLEEESYEADLKVKELKKKGDKAELEKAKTEAADLAARFKEMTAKAKGLKKTDVNPVGTGKFMLEDASPGNYLKLKRNPNWWFGKAIGQPDMPYMDGIMISIIPDPSVRLANLRAGKLHSMSVGWGVPLADRLVVETRLFA
jgi:peptide/nickel transport system substrate-binding protein